MTISPDQLQELKDRNPCGSIADKWVWLRKFAGHLQGRCPSCSKQPSKPGGTEFEAWDDHWVCAACEDGGDVVKLVMLHEGVRFPDAIDWLGGPREVDVEKAKKRNQELEDGRRDREAESAKYREAERLNLFRMWCEAPKGIAGTSLEAYHKLRGITVPGTMKLRCVERQPYYIPGDKPGSWRVVHVGPAQLAPLIGRDDKFAGLHFTWIDLAQPNGKAVLLHPADGAPLPAKKVRGSKKGSRIVLLDQLTPHGDPAHIFTLVIGEGIEKTAAVWMALEHDGRNLNSTAFWVAGDIGNMAGKAAASITHPELKTDKGRARRVPGPDPDPEDLGIPIPDTVTDLILLGDSTSDPFTTQCAMHRAAVRYSRPGRSVRVAWAPAGQDFDDMLREAA